METIEQPNKTEQPLTTWQVIKVYILTVLLAPFGLYWFFKYVRNTDPAKRRVAYIVLVLTILAIVFAVVSTAYVAGSYSDYLNSSMFDYSGI